MATHQTVRLARGAHASAAQGACVMELASMLAGEQYSDRPKSVSPLIARLLRAYNDQLDDERRQDLYPYAARVVGTQAPRAVERSRAARCIEWLLDAGVRVPFLLRKLPGPDVGKLAARHAATLGSERAHRDLLGLVDQLISFGDSWAGVPVNAEELLEAGGSAPTRASSG